MLKRLLALLLAIVMVVGMMGCAGDSDSCPICGGSGYYQKKDCPGC